MFEFLFILFFLAVYGVLHSYLVYPLYLFSTTNTNKKINDKEYLPGDKLPTVAILCAAYNEEKVIRQKIESVFDTIYPAELIKFYIGSDASTDATNSIIKD